ncbi:DUF4398 domain-containing protein [candidate division KSB1 bacterium]|nr:DUF4398 domain-containing protein [candidate division KSB1 bacterium]
MRAELFRAARRRRFPFRKTLWKVGGWWALKALWALLTLFVVACATSPSEQLNQAESLLSKLESSGADAYLTYELANARRQLEEARKFIRKNRFEMASQYLNSISQTLDSCSVAFLQKRQAAQQECQHQVATLLTDINNLGGMMAGLPRQSYIDQNRYDIYTHRVRRYREELDILHKLMAQQDFPTALQRSARLQFQVKQSLASLTGSASIPDKVASSKATTETPAPVAAYTSRSGSR